MLKYINKTLIAAAIALIGVQSGFTLSQNKKTSITFTVDPICKHYINGIYTKRIQFQTDTPKIDFNYIPGVKEYDGELAISAPLYVYANAVNKSELSLKLADINLDDKKQSFAFGIKVQQKNPVFEIFNIRMSDNKPFLYLNNKKIDRFDLSGLYCDVNSNDSELNFYCSCRAEN